MDSVFYADNLYNNVSFNGRPPSVKEPIEEPVEWSQHLNNLMGLMQTLGNSAREGKLSAEMDVGTLDSRGPVVVQIKRKLMARKIEPPVPAYTPSVEPWGRYKCFELEVAKNFKGKLLFENMHPLTNRELAIFFENERYVERSQRIRNSVTRPKAAMLTWTKRFECSVFWGMMPLLEIEGKLAPGAGTATSKSLQSSTETKKQVASDFVSVSSTEEKLESQSVAGSSTSSHHLGPNPDEVKVMAQMKSSRLHERIVTVAMNGPTFGHPRSSSEEALGNIIFKKSGTPSTKTSRDEMPTDVGSNNAPQRIFSEAHSHKVEPGKSTRSSVTRNEDALAADGVLVALRQKTLKLEKRALLAKLAFAQAEVAKVTHEQKALEAKMLHVKTEVETIQQCLEAYEEAEAKLSAS
uniref:Uncharacterized protein n=1 Tax=Grammatophora oceanica TaxID=210454 RepID=A0A6U5N5H5_9STRA